MALSHFSVTDVLVITVTYVFVPNHWKRFYLESSYDPVFGLWINGRSSLGNMKITQMLNMGHPANMSALVAKYGREGQAGCGYYKLFKTLK